MVIMEYKNPGIWSLNTWFQKIDIFKNNYNGRSVSSTGKIKTDFSREIKKETIVEVSDMYVFITAGPIKGFKRRSWAADSAIISSPLPVQC